MAVAFDAAADGAADSGSSVSYSHTCSGSDRLLIVGVAWRGTQTVSSVTYNGVAMTQVAAHAAGGNNTRVKQYYLINPASGANTVSVTMSGATNLVVGSISFNGAHQTTPLGTQATATGTSGNPSVSVSSASDEIVVDSLSYDRASSLTVGAGQTQRYNRDDNGGGDLWGAGSTEAGAASVTMSWTAGASEGWAIAGVSVKPSGGAAAATYPGCVGGFGGEC